MDEMESPEVTSAISTLETLNNTVGSQQVVDKVDEAVIVKPVEAVEQKLADFVADAFKATNKDLAFNESLKSEILKRLPKMTDNQIIALFSNNAVNTNDRISKIIAPTFGLMTAEQQALLAALQKQQSQNQTVVNVGGNNPEGIQPGMFDGMDKDAVRDMMQGFNTAYQVAFAAAQLANSGSETPTDNSQPQ
jgi:hypothetical protein